MASKILDEINEYNTNLDIEKQKIPEKMNEEVNKAVQSILDSLKPTYEDQARKDLSKKYERIRADLDNKIETIKIINEIVKKQEISIPQQINKYTNYRRTYEQTERAIKQEIENIKNQMNQPSTTNDGKTTLEAKKREKESNLESNNKDLENAKKWLLYYRVEEYMCKKNSDKLEVVLDAIKNNKELPTEAYDIANNYKMDMEKLKPVRDAIKNNKELPPEFYEILKEIETVKTDTNPKKEEDTNEEIQSYSGNTNKIDYGKDEENSSLENTTEKQVDSREETINASQQNSNEQGGISQEEKIAESLDDSNTASTQKVNENQKNKEGQTQVSNEERKILDKILKEMNSSDSTLGVNVELFSKQEIKKIMLNVNYLMGKDADYSKVLDIVRAVKSQIRKGTINLEEARKLISEGILEYATSDLDDITRALVMNDNIEEPLFIRKYANEIIDNAKKGCEYRFDNSVILSIINGYKEAVNSGKISIEEARTQIKEDIKTYSDLLKGKIPKEQCSLEYDLITLKTQLPDEEYEQCEEMAYRCREVADVKADWRTKMKWKIRDWKARNSKNDTLSLPEGKEEQVTQDDKKPNKFLEDLKVSDKSENDTVESPDEPESIKQVELSKTKTDVIDLSKDEADGMAQGIQQSAETKIAEIYAEAQKQAEKVQQEAIKAINIAKNSSPYYRENKSDDLEH